MPASAASVSASPTSGRTLAGISNIATAVPGKYAVEVRNLAQAEKLSGLAVADPTDALGLTGLAAPHADFTFLPTLGPKTLNGLILEHLQDIPESGVSFKIAGVPMEILQTQDRVIRTEGPRGHRCRDRVRGGCEGLARRGGRIARRAVHRQRGAVGGGWPPEEHRVTYIYLSTYGSCVERAAHPLPRCSTIRRRRSSPKRESRTSALPSP